MNDRYPESPNYSGRFIGRRSAIDLCADDVIRGRRGRFIIVEKITDSGRDRMIHARYLADGVPTVHYLRKTAHVHVWTPPTDGRTS